MNTIEIQKLIEEFIESNKERKRYVEGAIKHVIIDYSELIKYNIYFGELISENPEEFFRLAESAVERLKEKKVPVRIKNYHLFKSNEVSINEKRVEHLEKFWWIQGVVRKISVSIPIIVETECVCPGCGTIHKVPQLLKVLNVPRRCGCGSKSGFKQTKIKTQDMMKMVLEEDIEMLEGSEQPQRLLVLLKQGLTNKQIQKFATPGKKIIITGILKDVPKTFKDGKESVERDWVFIANFIEPIDDAEYNIQITKEDEKKIKKYSKDPKIYDKLVDAIAPMVKGYKNEKLALVLQSFGAVTKKDVNGKKIKRGYFHIGFFGDPATAKTSISKGLKNILPKYRATSGKHASAAGLTWGAYFDDMLKAYAIEAGAMVLASGATIIVDEADKIDKEDLGKMNQGLEDGYFEASKMNIQATLKAECAGLFIANPKEGRFNPYKSLYEQCDIDPTLVSRLIMMFIFRDVVDEKKDEDIAKHIFQTHIETEKILDTELSSDFIKKYIIYARKNCKPKLSINQMDSVANKYKELRATGNTEGRVAITPRQLEDIIRLSEAFAKVRLAKQVTDEDIENAFNLMMFSLKSCSLDSKGNIDIDMIELGGKTYEVRNKSEMFEMTLTKLIEENGNKAIDMQNLINALVENGFNEIEIDKMIQQRSKEGHLYEPKRGMIMKL